MSSWTSVAMLILAFGALCLEGSHNFEVDRIEYVHQMGDNGSLFVKLHDVPVANYTYVDHLGNYVEDNKHVVEGLKLDLGAGFKRKPGWVAVDMFGEPDVKMDIETYPWPWPDNSVSEVYMSHVLEHVGQTPRAYLRFLKELYRVCRNGAEITVIVPHPRHSNFLDDPTHVRAVTTAGLELLSRSMNKEWSESPKEYKRDRTLLAFAIGVDFEIRHFIIKPSEEFYTEFGPRIAKGEDTMVLLTYEASTLNQMIEQTSYFMRVLKHND